MLGCLTLITATCHSRSLFLGYELLFQPEVVRIYISLLKESKTPAVLEASAGAIQNLCAGRWTVSHLQGERAWESSLKKGENEALVLSGARAHQK